MKKIMVIILAVFIIFGTGTVFPKTSKELLTEAKLLRTKGYPDSAIAIYNQMLKDNPDNNEAIMQFADFMVEIRNYSKALELYKKYLNIVPDDIFIRKIVIDIYNSVGLFEDAINECLIFLNKNPENLEILYRLGEIYENNKLYSQQMIITEKILELEPYNDEAKKLLIKLYVMVGEYEKALGLIERNKMYGEISLDLMGYIYLNTNNFKKSINIYDRTMKENPTDVNQNDSLRARLAKTFHDLSLAPRSYSCYYNTLTDTVSLFPGNPKLGDIMNYLSHDIAGLYAGYLNTTGKSSGNLYSSNYFKLFYPILSSGTEVSLSQARYTIGNSNLTSTYTQTGVECNHYISDNIVLSGAYRTGSPGNTYYGQVYYRGDSFEVAVNSKKGYIIESPEAIANGIAYNGMLYYGNYYLSSRFNIFGHTTDINVSDGNRGIYYEFGGIYRLIDNHYNSSLDLAVYKTAEQFNYTSPLYYSPEYFSLFNYSLQFTHYFKKDSLLRIGYINSTGDQGTNYNIYTLYADHKFAKNLFVFGEYINGLSRMGKIGAIEQPSSQDYELNLGIRYKF